MYKGRKVLRHCGKSLLFDNKEGCLKKEETFNVTIGGFNGAKILRAYKYTINIGSN